MGSTTVRKDRKQHCRVRLANLASWNGLFVVGELCFVYNRSVWPITSGNKHNTFDTKQLIIRPQLLLFYTVFASVFTLTFLALRCVVCQIQHTKLVKRWKLNSGNLVPSNNVSESCHSSFWTVCEFGPFKVNSRHLSVDSGTKLGERALNRFSVTSLLLWPR